MKWIEKGLIIGKPQNNKHLLQRLFTDVQVQDKLHWMRLFVSEKNQVPVGSQNQLLRWVRKNLEYTISHLKK